MFDTQAEPSSFAINEERQFAMVEYQETFNQLGGLEPAAGDTLIPVPVDELAALEGDIGDPLPARYREFLGSYGASSFGESVAFQPVQPLPAAISSTGKGGFSHFFGATTPAQDETLSLSWNLATYRDRMPETMIPIASDGGGDLICLVVTGDEVGKVYYWDHNNEWDEDDYLDQDEPVPADIKFQNVHLIAHSFEEFISRLIPDD